MAGNEVVIGIDLGTTNSCMAVVENGNPRVLENADGARTTPSVVNLSFDEKGNKQIEVGQAALRKAILKPSETLIAIKRLIGRKFEDVQKSGITNHVSYKVVGNKDGDACVEVGGKVFHPSEISAMILSYLKENAEQRLGKKVTGAVITVPAYFNDAQRQATKDAGKIAGLDVKRIINEPTAAAFAYGIDKKNTSGTLAVYDLGGGTFDVSILDINDGVFEVKSTNGDTMLGGEDFDNALVEYIILEFLRTHSIDLSKDKQAMQRLKESAKNSKQELSSSPQVEINLPFITIKQDEGPQHLNMTITRAKLVELTRKFIERSTQPCLQAIQDSKVAKEDIKPIILVGGMTRMPAVRDHVKSIFNKSDADICLDVNPDEVVAIGAAIQGAVLSGGMKDDLVLLDVTPLSLGIETEGGILTVLIPRNTTIPTKKSQIFSTAADNQTSVTIAVGQGERPLAKDNKILGRFDLLDIPPAPRGVPQIEVTFDIDVDGIVNVSAQDKGTGKENRIVIKGQGGLSKEEIEQRVAEFEEYKEQDKAAKDLIEKKNTLATSIYSAEKALKDHGEKLGENDRESVRSALEKAKSLQEKDINSSDEIDAVLKNLQESSQKLGEVVYKEAQAQQADIQKNDAGESSDDNNSSESSDTNDSEEVKE